MATDITGSSYASDRGLTDEFGSEYLHVSEDVSDGANGFDELSPETQIQEASAGTGEEVTEDTTTTTDQDGLAAGNIFEEASNGQVSSHDDRYGEFGSRFSDFSEPGEAGSSEPTEGGSGTSTASTTVELFDGMEYGDPDDLPYQNTGFEGET